MRDFLPKPEEVEGWKVVETRLVRSDNQLYDYMDGGAEVYRAFNFRRLAVRTFSGGVNDNLSVEVFAFKETADAYGIFSMLPEGEKYHFGSGAGYMSGVLRFWKGPYYCKIFVSGDWTHYKNVIIKAGEAVDSKIEAVSEPPDIIRLMPEKDRVKEGLHYFHENISLKNLVYISHLNFLKLTRKTEAVMGRFYNLKAETAYLILVKYPSEKECEEAYASVLADFLKVEVQKPDNFHLKTTIEPARNVEIDRMGAWILFGFEDVQSELLSARVKEIKRNLREYLKEK